MGAAGFSDHDIGAAAPLGFRSWQIFKRDFATPVMRSVTYSESVWGGGVNEARCLTSQTFPRLVCEETLPHRHDKPCYRTGPCGGVDRNCTCGFWAYTEAGHGWYGSRWPQGSRSVGRLASIDTVQVHGLIYGFGKCVCGPLGFRASKALVAALVLPIRPAVNVLRQATELTAEQIEHISDTLATRFSTARIFPSVEAMTTAMPLEPIPLEQS